jgi:hypothetical protein
MEARSMARRTRRGDVHFDGDYDADRMYLAGRDINLYDLGGIGAIQATGGIPKLFVIAGLVLSYVGAAMFFYVVVSFIVTIWSSMGSSEPPDMTGVADIVVPWLPVGVGLAFVGGVIGSIALAVGKPRSYR